MILFSQASLAKENKFFNKKFFNKKNMLVVGLTIINPAVSLGTIVTNAERLEKRYQWSTSLILLEKGKI